MASIFSKIISGEITCHKIAETDDYLAFLDIHPVTKGHTLVIPKLEHDYIFDLEEPYFSGLFVFAKQVASMLKRKTNCARVGIGVLGFDVPHAHIHLIPLETKDDFDFKSPHLSLSQDELAAIAKNIKGE